MAVNVVSILVFLDQALKECQADKRCRFGIGFNPCFPGSSAESSEAFDKNSKIYVFQSLFSWIKR